MEIVISNKSKQGLKQVNVSSNNNIGQVNFSKVAKVTTIAIADLRDVVVPSTILNGAILTYNSVNNNYVFLNNIDGGTF